MKQLITFVILTLVSLASQMFTILPWWSFLIPVFLLGVILPLEKWKISSFILGFSAGFLVWLFSTIYFEEIYKGEIMFKLSKIISVHHYLTYIVIGFIGGVITGLAFYSGFLLRKGRDILLLELPKN